MRQLDPEKFYPSPISGERTCQTLKEIDPICPEIAKDVKKYLDAPIVDYGHHLFRDVDAPDSEERSKSTDLLQAQFRKLGFVDKVTVIQTSNHCQLLLDAPSFYSTFLTWLGAKADGRQSYVVFNSINVTMETRARTGPGWVSMRGASYPLFKVSRRSLERTSVCGLTHTQFHADTLEKLRLEGVELSSSVGSSEALDKASALITSANVALHQNWAESGPKVYFITDEFIADLVAQHIKARTVLHTLLFTDDRRTKLLMNLEEQQNDPRNGRLVPRSTQLFWLVEAGKVQPLRFDGRRLVCGKMGCQIDFEEDTILEMLEKRILVPDLFLLFTVLSFFPCVRALGGLRQIGYVPLLHKALLNSLDQSNESERGLFHSMITGPQHGWTMRAVDSAMSVLEVGVNLGHSELFTKIEGCLIGQTLRQTSGGLARLSVHPAWEFARNE